MIAMSVFKGLGFAPGSQQIMLHQPQKRLEMYIHDQRGHAKGWDLGVCQSLQIMSPGFSP